VSTIAFQLLVPPPLEDELPAPNFDLEDLSWFDRAECLNYEGPTSPWTDATNANEKRIALRICWLECPVRQECLTAGLLPVWLPIGIYGGRNANQRRLLKIFWREQGIIADDDDDMEDESVKV